METTAGSSNLYLTGLAQFQSDTWVYQHPDGLGSVRQLTDNTAQVTLGQSYDPFGNLFEQTGSSTSGFGYTGEQKDSSIGLVFLRARYYDPAVGIFLSKDRWSGNVRRSQTMNGWAYVAGNPVTKVDPSGLRGQDVNKPELEEWMANGGISVGRDTFSFAIDQVIQNRHHIVSAAIRHGFVPGNICDADGSQKQQLYALAGIIYQESVGQYREKNGLDERDKPYEGTLDSLINSASMQVAGAYYGPLDSLLSSENILAFDPRLEPLDYFADSSIGIAQIRPLDTAMRIEMDGLLYDPYQSVDGELVKAKFTLWELMTSNGNTYAIRVNRLLDPAWAIEYAAANLHRGTIQPLFNNSFKHRYLEDQELTRWQKMAAWYNTGVFDTYDDRVGDKIVGYLDIIWTNMVAIEALDLLGVEAECAQCSPLIFR